MKRFVCLFVIIIMLVIACGGGGGGTEFPEQAEQTARTDQLKIIASRFEELVWNQGYRYFEMDITEVPVKSEVGYYLNSVDYAELKPSYWPAIRHLEYWAEKTGTKS